MNNLDNYKEKKMKLKTLNDICIVQTDKDKVKKQAIKWVKEDLEDFDINLNDDLPIDLQCMLRGWMERLDIKEEDLKEV